MSHIAMLFIQNRSLSATLLDEELQRWRPMRVLPHLPGPMPVSEHRSCSHVGTLAASAYTTFPNC
jgi:hypothetical protein